MVTSLSIHTAPSSPPSSNRLRILCLHGAFQSGSIFSQKIGGARRKLERVYDLDFLDGPVECTVEEPPSSNDGDDDDDDQKDPPQLYAWWKRDEVTQKHVGIREVLEYVGQHCARTGLKYDAVLGFSQGGTLATALALSGLMDDNVKAVVTAGAPYVPNALEVARELATEKQQQLDNSIWDKGLAIPKLHLAGERDAMIPVESVRRLCDEGGNGEFIVHEQGHLFPTRAVRVNRILDFLQEALAETTDE